MTILLVCEKLDGYGGWYTYAKGLKKGLEAKGHTVTTCERGVLPAPLACLTNPMRAYFAAKKLRKVIDQVQPDIVHIIVEPYAMLVPFLPREQQAKIVLTIHGSYGIRPLEMWPAKILAKKYYRAIPTFITVSEYTKERVAEALGSFGSSFKERTVVVKNGIVLPVGRGQKSVDSVKRILLVGGVKPRKGVLEAIVACAKFRERSDTPFEFAVIGRCDEGDTYVETVQKRIGELHLQNAVHLRGQISDEELREEYAKADLYLMPAPTGSSTFEGFGIVFIEAAAYGVASIGPETSGAAEAIVENETGYHVDPSNAELIAEKMQWILDEEKINQDVCRKWAEKHSIEKMVEQIENVYATL